jgi:hypothetical protein
MGEEPGWTATPTLRESRNGTLAFDNQQQNSNQHEPGLNHNLNSPILK